MTFGQWLVEKRESLRLQPTDCAETAGLTPSQWSDYEKDRSRRKDGKPTRPTPQTISAIARGLGIGETEVFQALIDAGLEPVTSFRTDALKTKSYEAIYADVFAKLDQPEADHLLAIAQSLVEAKQRLTSNRQASKPTRAATVLPSTRYQYDIEEHRLYTHDGRPASEVELQNFVQAVDDLVVSQSISVREEEAILDPR